MKKTNILMLVLTAVINCSCLDSFLNIDPLTTITTEKYWQSESDARAELNAAYAHIQNTYKTGFLYWTEARADNMLGNITGNFPVQNVCLNRLNASHTACDWNNWYKVVSVANYGIYFIPQMTGRLSEQKQNHLLSEAYFLRAYAYYNLCRIWGDVPLVVKPILKKSEVQKPVVTDKDSVFAQVVRDIEKAVELVDETQEELYLYSPGALYALATDIAMWAKDYEKALVYSQALYDLNRYTLEGTKFSEVCALATTTDNIWTLKWDYASNGENSITITLANSANPLIPNLQIFDKWFEWEREAGKTDLRRAATIDSSKYKNYTARHVVRLPTGAQTWKWSPGEHKPQNDYHECYVPLYRLADVILLRAEALYQTKDYQGAITEMNKVRVRAGLPEKDELYYEGRTGKLIEDIWQERQFELFAEGKRWFDLMRTGRVEQVMNTYFTDYIKVYGGTEYNLYSEEWQMYWPIYQDILNENSGYLHQIGNY